MTAKCMKCGEHILDCQCELGTNHNEHIKRMMDEYLERNLYSIPPDPGQTCEHPDAFQSIISRLEELEKRIAALEKIIIPLEFNQEIHAKLIYDMIKNLDAKP